MPDGRIEGHHTCRSGKPEWFWCSGLSTYLVFPSCFLFDFDVSDGKHRDYCTRVRLSFVGNFKRCFGICLSRWKQGKIELLTSAATKILTEDVKILSSYESWKRLFANGVLRVHFGLGGEVAQRNF